MEVEVNPVTSDSRGNWYLLMTENIGVTPGKVKSLLGGK